MKPEEVLELLLKAIVRQPQSVQIEAQADEMGVLLRARVAREDMGAVIGKSGIHAKALKLLIKLAGFRNSQNVAVKIEEPI